MVMMLYEKAARGTCGGTEGGQEAAGRRGMCVDWTYW